MSPETIQRAVEQYLEERRALGFDLRIAGQQLLRFARYADTQRHRGPLTRELQLTWARDEARRADAITWARRVEILRPFARYYRQFEPQTAVLETTTFGRAHRRLTPHIYTAQEMVDLLNAAGRLQPTGLRPATYQTLFGLIAAVGLRLSEAIHLRDVDVDVRSGALTIRATKFKKSRWLPMHPSTVDALDRYRRVRDRTIGPAPDNAFFLGPTGRPLPIPTVHGVFARLRCVLGWTARGGHPRPRIHDLRHTFAVRRVQQWQESGLPMDQGMFWLSTYLGHASIANTYWYLTGVPELFAVVSQRFERFAAERPGVDHE